MSWTAGEVMNTTSRLQRLSESGPTSYTCWIDGSTYRAECNVAGGSDYSGTDASTVLQAAIDAIPHNAGNTENGGVIFIKRGHWELSAGLDLELKKCIALLGEGNRYGTNFGTVLTLNNSVDEHVIFANNDSGAADKYYGVLIENLQIYGNKANQTSNVDGIHFEYTYQVHIDNVSIQQAKYNGIKLLNCEVGRIHNAFIDLSGNHGIWLNANSVELTRCDVEKSTGHDVYVGGGGNFIGYNALATSGNDGGSYSGVYLESNTAQENTVHGNVIVDPNDNGIVLYDGARYNTVTCNKIKQATHYGIVLSDSGTLSTDNTISHNICYTNDYGFGALNLADYNIIDHNNFRNNTSGAGIFTTSGTHNQVHFNKAWITENSGTSSITNGNTSQAVAHGLSVTPTVDDFTIIGAENPANDVGTIWIDTIGAANFTVNVEADPGASNWDFGWKVIVL